MRRSGFAASISGGSGNKAKGNYTSVSGGKQRDAVEQDSWRGGSLLERELKAVGGEGR